MTRRDELTNAAGGFRAELGLQHRNRGVDDAQADARHDSTYNQLRAAIRGCLQHGADDHDPAPVGDGPFTTETLAKDGRQDRAKEASH